MNKSRDSVPTLAVHALSIAKYDLMALCEAGIIEHSKERYDYNEQAYRSSQNADSLYSPTRLPNRLTNRAGFLAAGVFQMLTLKDILKVCFTSEAIDYLVKSGYNDYIFWSNFYAFCAWMINTPVEQQSMPFGLDLVKEQILLRRIPFGSTQSPYRDFNRKLIKAAIDANGGVFDPNKLEPGYALDLLDVGLLLCLRRRHYNDVTDLIVNPMWQHFVDEIAADTTIGAAPVQVAPVVAAPTVVRGTLYASGKITGSLDVELGDGYTAQEVADMLTDGRAHVKGASVLLPHAPPAEGSMIIASVFNPRPGLFNYSPVSWSLEKPVDEPCTATAVPAVQPDPNGKRVKLSALGRIEGEIEVETFGGHSLTEIAELLTSHRARISDDNVVVPHEAPAEGMMNIAKIVSQKQFPTPVGPVVWTVVG